VQLTRDGTLKYSPKFADGGKSVIYARFADTTLLRLMKVGLADGKVEILNPSATKNEFDPALSPDGRLLAFVQTRGLLSLALVMRDLENNRDAEVPPAQGLAGMRSPAVAPDKSRVVYSFAEDARQKLYVVSAQGGTPKMLTDGKGLDNWPGFSPDGSQIVFGSSRDGNFELYLMHSDGTDVRRITNHPSEDKRPSFSPDGKRIAFTSRRDGEPHVYVMNADGSDVRRLETGGETDDYAAWHPDGRRLVLVSEREGKHDLYLVDAP